MWCGFDRSAKVASSGFASHATGVVITGHRWYRGIVYVISWTKTQYTGLVIASGSGYRSR